MSNTTKSTAAGVGSSEDVMGLLVLYSVLRVASRRHRTDCGGCFLVVVVPFGFFRVADGGVGCLIFCLVALASFFAAASPRNPISAQPRFSRFMVFVFWKPLLLADVWIQDGLLHL